MEKIVSLAGELDGVVAQSGWGKILDHAAERINVEIAKARRIPDDPIQQQNIVVRWDAMATLLDEIQDFVERNRKERDRILEMRREEEYGKSASYTN